MSHTPERLWLLGTLTWLFYIGYLIFAGHLSIPSSAANDQTLILLGSYRASVFTQVFVYSVVVVPPAMVLGLGWVLHWLLKRPHKNND